METTAPVAPEGTTSLDNLLFVPLSDLDGVEILKAKNIARTFQKAIDPLSLEFNFDTALKLADADDSMAVIGTVNQTIQQSQAQVTVMVDKVEQLLKTLLEVALTEGEMGNYQNSITNAFTNLAPQEGNAWIFWSHSEAHKTTYQYNIFFAVKKGECIEGMPIGLTISTNVEKEQVLFVTVTDKHEYTVNVKALRVVVPLLAS